MGQTPMVGGPMVAALTRICTMNLTRKAGASFWQRRNAQVRKAHDVALRRRSTDA